MSFLFSVLQLSFTRFLNKHITFVILILPWTFEWPPTFIEWAHFYATIFFVASYLLESYLLFYVRDNHKFMQCRFSAKRIYRGWTDWTSSCSRFVLFFESFQLCCFSLDTYCCVYELVSSLFSLTVLPYSFSLVLLLILT